MSKLQHQAKRWMQFTIKGTLFPIFEPTRIFEWIALAALLFISYNTGELWGDLLDLNRTITAFLMAIPAWFLIQIVVGFFRMRKEDKSLGEWVSDNEFVFHGRHHVKTLQVTPMNEGEVIEIKVPLVPKGAFVSFEHEYERGLGMIAIYSNKYMAKANGVITEFHRQKVGLKITEKQTVGIAMTCPSDSLDTTVRIFMTRWRFE